MSLTPTLTLTDSLVSTVAGGSPPVQALTLDFVKLYIRSLNTADDELIHNFIDAAASYFEGDTTRQLLTAVREAALDAFPFLGASGPAARIELPHPPLQAVESITYLDANGVTQTLAAGESPEAFRVMTPRGHYAYRGTVEPLGAWPVAANVSGAVTIRYRCGYGDTPEEMPPLVRHVLCELVGHYDTFRSAVHAGTRSNVQEIPLGVTAMLVNFKYSAKGSQRLFRNALGVSA